MNATMGSRRLLSIGAVARIAGVSPTTLRRMERAGIVTPARLEGFDQRLYSADDVKAIVAARAKHHDEGPE